MQKTLTVLVPALLILFTLQHSSSIAVGEQSKNNNIELAQDKTDKKKPSSNSKITLEEILEKHYQAIGGDEAWKSVDTIKFSGRMSTKNGVFRTAAIFKRPDLCRLDFQSGRLYFMEAYDGNIPWQMNPGTRNGPEILKGKRAKQMIDTCDFEGPLVDHKKKGHKITYLGEEQVEDRQAYLLEVNFNTGNIDKYYLDTQTYLPFMVKGTTTIQDRSVNSTIMVSEYIEIDDIKIPFAYEFIVDDNPDTETLRINTVELNSEVDNTIFNLPKRPQDLR